MNDKGKKVTAKLETPNTEDTAEKIGEKQIQKNSFVALASQNHVNTRNRRGYFRNATAAAVVAAADDDVSEDIMDCMISKTRDKQQVEVLAKK